MFGVGSSPRLTVAKCYVTSDVNSNRCREGTYNNNQFQLCPLLKDVENETNQKRAYAILLSSFLCS